MYRAVSLPSLLTATKSRLYSAVYIRLTRLPLFTRQEADPPKTAYWRRSHVNDAAVRQITQTLPRFEQPITWPRFVHIIYGAITVD